MAANTESLQLIARLTPLTDVLALIATEVSPVIPRTVDLEAATGRTLAADVTAPARPTTAIALADGWALAAELTLGASGYAPAILVRVPPRVEVGQAMPPGTDSVAPFDAVNARNGNAEAVATVNPGDGILAAGGDCDPAIPLRRIGERLRLGDIAALSAAGIARVTVREPRLRVLPLRGSAMVDATARLVTGDIARRGGAARLDKTAVGLEVAMAADAADAIIAIGGTGSGRSDASVQILADEGRLAVHGIALAPGETAALGFAGRRPVLLLPGRFDAALAVWLTVGRRLLEQLAGCKEREEGEALTLARKISSTVGLAELVPVRRNADNLGAVEPLAARYLPLSSITRADGYILVRAESEGFAAGSAVQVWPWP
jgi:molybdopterin biosynthesis enzyme